MNLLQLKDALGGVTTIAYAPGRAGKLPTSITDAKGHSTTLNYDAQGRVTSAVQDQLKLDTLSFGIADNLVP